MVQTCLLPKRGQTYSRHIDIRRHYIRELSLGNLVKLVSLRTNLVVADALTESLPISGLERHRSVMMGHFDFQELLLQTVHGGQFLSIYFGLLKSASVRRVFRMGESDYLNDNTMSQKSFFMVQTSLLTKRNILFFSSQQLFQTLIHTHTHTPKHTHTNKHTHTHKRHAYLPKIFFNKLVDLVNARTRHDVSSHNP